MKLTAVELGEVAEALPTPLTLLDPEGTVLWANAADLALLGYTPAEYVGQPMSGFYVDEGALDSLLDRVGRGEIVRAQAARLEAKDGSFRDVRIDATGKRENGVLVRVQCLTRDVTAPNGTSAAARSSPAEVLAALAASVVQVSTREAALHASLEALESGLGIARAVVCTIGDGGTLRVAVSRGFHAGEPPPTCAGRVARWSNAAEAWAANPLGEASAETNAEVVERAVALVGGDDLIGELVVYVPRGRSFSAEEAQLARAIGCHAVAALQRFASAGDLQRNAHFNETFAAMLGHDLRNPLAAMVMAAQVMLKREDTTAMSKPLARIVSSGGRMARMIDQIIDFTRLRLGSGVELVRGPCDLRLIIQHAIKEVGGEREVHVEPVGNCQGAWDGDRLAQVFSSLVANAVHHGSTERAVEVSIDGSAPEQVVVAIHNDGAMDRALVPVLFEPMAGRDRRTAKSRGMGLGLYISHALVRAHGGRITVDTDEARGTTFTVVLPRVPR